jgi:ZIP family zinc transporter
MFEQANIPFALILSTLAGLSTGIGSVIAYFIQTPKKEYLCFSLGLSGGVMIYVSFIELLPEAFISVGEIIGLYAFFTGFIIMGIIDILIPEEENPHAFKGFEKSAETNKSLLRVGMLTALAVAIHNFPEGFATFGSALSDVRVGILIAFAVAIHNIPEGISVYMPIFYATGDKRKAFLYSFLSGVAEPIAAVIGLIILLPFLTDELLAVLLAFVAGIMVYISVDELLPVARQYESGHCAILGIVMGMFIMAISLLFI